MKRNLRTLIIFIFVSICLIILGIQWRSSEIDKLKKLDYRQHSQCVMQYNTLDPQSKITETKEIMRENYMHFIDEYPIEDINYEIIGQSGNSWLFSGYLHKINFAVKLAKPLDSTETPIWQLLVYAGDAKSGSMVYFTILCLCLMTFIGFAVKKKNLPHIFPTDNDKQNIDVGQNENI